MAGGFGGNSNPDKIKGGRWTVVKFFALGVRPSFLICNIQLRKHPISFHSALPPTLLVPRPKTHACMHNHFHYPIPITCRITACTSTSPRNDCFASSVSPRVPLRRLSPYLHHNSYSHLETVLLSMKALRMHPMVQCAVSDNSTELAVSISVCSGVVYHRLDGYLQRDGLLPQPLWAVYPPTGATQLPAP